MTGPSGLTANSPSAVWRSGATDAARLSEAIRRLAAEPTDTGSLLLHASITGVEATPGGWQATVVLGEGAVA